MGVARPLGIEKWPCAPDPSYVPKNSTEFLQCMEWWSWRIFSGQMYKIMVKGDEDAVTGQKTQLVLPFIPNGPQVDLLRNMHLRNVILKARQLGFTTVIDIYLLDHALFNDNARCGIIAHSKEDVLTIFRDKVQFAYESMPEIARATMPLKTQNKSEYVFAHNNASIRVAMSMRSGTIHRLHVSEMGKLAAKYPAKAEEVVTGSLPAVPKTGVAFIESTAEGQAGEFYNIATQAEALKQSGRQLSASDWMFHFYPWWSEPKYAMDPSWVIISDEDHAYFDLIEIEMNTLLTMRQRAWYVAKRDRDFSYSGI